jgi:hypothetical protein
LSYAEAIKAEQPWDSEYLDTANKIPDYWGPDYGNGPKTWGYSGDPYYVNHDDWIDVTPEAYKVTGIDGYNDLAQIQRHGYPGVTFFGPRQPSVF